MYLGHTTRTVKYCFCYFTQFGKHCQLNIFNISEQIKSDMLPFLKPLQDHTSLSVSHTSFRILNLIKNRRKNQTNKGRNPISAVPLSDACAVSATSPHHQCCVPISLWTFSRRLFIACVHTILSKVNVKYLASQCLSVFSLK